MDETGTGSIVGLDVGGTKTAVLVTDARLQVLAAHSRPTDTASPQALLAGVRAAVDAALAEAGVDPAQVTAVGAGVAGHIDAAQGVVRLAVNLNLREFPLGAALQAAFGRPVVMDNDVRTAVLGAYRFACQDASLRHVAYLSIGTGISAGLVVDGRVYRGAHGMAGEIGHLPLLPNGERCSCGARGCLETVAAGPAIARRWQQERGAAPDARVTARDVFAAARQGDAAAQRVIQRTGVYVARAIHWLALAYDVEKIILGGGVTHAGTPFLNPVLQALDQIRAESALAASLLGDEPPLLLPRDYDPGTWGAVLLARQARGTRSEAR